MQVGDVDWRISRSRSEGVGFEVARVHRVTSMEVRWYGNRMMVVGRVEKLSVMMG